MTFLARNRMKKTICSIIAAIALAGCSAANEQVHRPKMPEHSEPASQQEPGWEYRPLRCGFTITQRHEATYKQLEYTLQEDGGAEVQLRLNAPGKDSVEITAIESMRDDRRRYSVTRINNRDAMETCYGEGQTMACPTDMLLGAEQLIRENMQYAEPYIFTWLQEHSFRCNILGGW